MKKSLILVVAVVLCAAMVFTACGTPAATEAPASEAPASEAPASEAPASEAPAAAPVELTVVTSYGGEDSNRANYEEAYKAWAADTGNTVLDNSGTATLEWEAKVNTDFESGTEPDVLFYYTGSQLDTILSAGKVVSLDEIRAEYPDYASNMNEELLPVSTDGNKYAVPTTGYWESMYVNTKVLDEAGVAIPGADYTWDQFLADCQKIKDAGKTPIACSLQEVPHYWFEFVVMNNGNVDNQLDLPAAVDDAAGQKWVAGLNDIKDLYEKGFFPENTLTATDNETFQLIYDGDAAFAVDGSWKLNAFNEAAGDHIDDFAVLYVPGKGERKATDVIGGVSMGYMITKKAWDDPAKRDAAVSFVQAMTSDDVVNKFAATNVATSALKAPKLDASSAPTSLHVSALEMVNGITGIAPAVQDTMRAGKAEVLDNVKNIVSGNMTAEDVVTSAIPLFNVDPEA